MVHANSSWENYLTLVSNGEFTLPADTTADKGGGGQGFRPHDLLEAALASCLNISLRMAAEKLGVGLDQVSVSVSLNRNAPEGPSFACEVSLPPSLSLADRTSLLAAVESCPVKTTLSKPLHFNLTQATPC